MRKYPLTNAQIVRYCHLIRAALEDGKGGFCDSVARDLRNGNVPTGRGYFIMLDILAKRAGRANSHAYKARYNELISEFETI